MPTDPVAPTPGPPPGRLEPIPVDASSPDPAIVAMAGRILREGGVVAHPADTIYGLAAAAHHAGGLARLRLLKGRAEERPFILLIDEPGRVDQLAHSIHRYVIRWISTVWPAPLTLILNARPGTPGRAPDGSVALRCPAQPLTRALVRETAGLLASTSANRSGEPPVAGAREAIALFGGPPGGLDLALDERPALDAPISRGLDRRPPSTIVDARGAVPLLVRAGAVSAAALGLPEPPAA